MTDSALLAIDISGVTTIVGWVIYLLLAMTAIWGAFCVAMVWTRVSRQRFVSEDEQSNFLDTLDTSLEIGDFASAEQLCTDDPRATPQLALLALNNRKVGYAKVRQIVMDRFQRDVLADLDHRLNWVATVIKSAPMLGLLGTVIGMMGAFGKLSSSEGAVNADGLAADIMVALITTACGLAIAIPLVFCTASINIRIAKMEDLVGAGLTRFFDSFRAALTRKQAKPQYRRTTQQSERTANG